MDTDEENRSTENVDYVEWYRRTKRRTEYERNETEDCQECEVRFTLSSGARHRFRFEPRVNGPSWWRFEDEWTGCAWRPIGREPVRDIKVFVTERGNSND